MLPLISIVTPSYNQGRFLRRTIESVLSQAGAEVEYLVLDGGSTDESVDILRSYGSRFFWRSERDGGQADAINKGLRMARGEILAYLNSDDVLLPGAVRTVVAQFEKNPTWDLIYGDAWNIDEDDRRLGPFPTAEYRFERLLESCCICQPAAFWRRRITDRVGLFDASLRYALDYEYWMRIDRAGGKLVHVPEFLACSRDHDSTKTRTARLEMYREILAVSRRHAGEASFSQLLAYWHHRCRERPRGWPSCLRRWSGAPWWLAVAQQRWHRHDGNLAALAVDACRTLTRKACTPTRRVSKAEDPR